MEDWRSDIPDEIIKAFENVFERLLILEKHMIAEYKVFKNYYFNYIESMKKIKNNENKEG